MPGKLFSRERNYNARKVNEIAFRVVARFEVIVDALDKTFKNIKASYAER